MSAQEGLAGPISASIIRGFRRNTPSAIASYDLAPITG